MIFLEREISGGTQVIYKFNNGYGASVVCHDFSYGSSEGLKELAVLKFESGDKWNLCYDTPVTNDVIGYLSDEEVAAILVDIKSLE